MSIRVCIVPAGYKPIPPVLGGAVETIIQNLIDLNEKHHAVDFTVLSVYNDKAKEISDLFKYTKTIFFSGNEKIDYLYYWCIYKIFKRFFNIIFPDFLIRNQMINYIANNQDEYDWILVEAGELDCLRFYSKKLDWRKIIYHSHGEIRNEKNLENSLHYYIAVSNYIKNIWADTVKWKPNRSLTLLNGINQSKFEGELSLGERERRRNEMGFSASDIVLIFVGRIVPEKGAKELLEAMKQFPDTYKLLMIGSASFGAGTATSYEKEIGILIDQLGNRVVFTGFIPNDQVGVYYKLGDISVVPSLFDDPAPLVIIEAMTSGLPIITTGSGGIKEYCDDSCVKYVDRGSNMVNDLVCCISEIGDNEEMRMAMGEASKRKSTLFTDEKQYNDLVDILYNLER